MTPRARTRACRSLGVDFVDRQILLDNGSRISAVEAVPSSGAARTVVVLGHGAGNDMHSPFLSAVHAGLAARGHAAVKFNFPYKERGGRAPDSMPVLEACYRRVLADVRAQPHLASLPLVIGGKSMGGRTASHLAAAGEPIAGLLLLGYPLHPAGRPDELRREHLPRIAVPMLLFSGTRDPLCRLDLLRETLAPLRAPVSLHVIDGGDHSFDLPRSMRRDPGEVWDEIVAATDAWLAGLPTAGAPRGRTART